MTVGMGLILVTALALSIRYLLTSGVKTTRYRKVAVVVQLDDVTKISDAIKAHNNSEPPTITLPVCHEYEPEFGALGCWCGEYSDAPQHWPTRRKP